ncbi:hypothetical protein WG66_014250 [Moniliophthora roreri]|nr:hypothetical protein WG66_014250 [Moniliophthora roreri]
MIRHSFLISEKRWVTFHHSEAAKSEVDVYGCAWPPDIWWAVQYRRPRYSLVFGRSSSSFTADYQRRQPTTPKHDIHFPGATWILVDLAVDSI